MNHRKMSRLMGLLTLVAVGGMSAGLAGPATAATGALPDGSQTANLHVTKLETPTGAEGDGTQQAGLANDPIAGVEFTIQKVDPIDLTTRTGWLDANALSQSYASAAPTNPAAAADAVTGEGYTLIAAGSDVSATDGTVDFSGLDLGLYLVTETDAPAGVTPSAPFLVTLPMTNPNGTADWMYDVFVYPKNAITGVTKTVSDDSAVKLGDDISFTVIGDIPDSTSPDDEVSGYRITDKLDSKLTYDGTKPATAVLADGSVSLVSGTDYVVSHDAGTNTVQVDFTAAGLAKLTAHRDTKVVVTIPATVNTSGEISNTAMLFPDAGAIDGTTGTPLASNPVQTKWGNVTVKKVAEDGATALAGAEFQVFTSKSDADSQSNPVTIEGEDTFTSGADGELLIDGLRYSGFADNESFGSADGRYITYYLVETKAPTGYELLAEPISFTVDAETSAVGVDLEVTNVPSNAGFQLPFTGGPGGTLLYIAGALLISGATLLSMKKRKANDA